MTVFRQRFRPGRHGRLLSLDTSLLGPLTIPHGAGREAELTELVARASHYATRGDGTRRKFTGGEMLVSALAVNKRT